MLLVPEAPGTDPRSQEKEAERAKLPSQSPGPSLQGSPEPEELAGGRA